MNANLPGRLGTPLVLL